MKDKKGIFSKIFTTKTSLLIGILIFGFFSLAFASSYYKNYQLRHEIKSMLDEAEKIENSNAELRSLLEKVKSPVYTEQIGRKNFGLVKPGENQVILVGDLDKTSRQAESGVVESTKLSNPLQWWNYFFNHN